ncbi:ATP-binding cassette domain-containing protein [Microbacterium sp. LMI1-1-1.1]
MKEPAVAEDADLEDAAPADPTPAPADAAVKEPAVAEDADREGASPADPTRADVPVEEPPVVAETAPEDEPVPSADEAEAADRVETATLEPGEVGTPSPVASIDTLETTEDPTPPDVGPEDEGTSARADVEPAGVTAVLAEPLAETDTPALTLRGVSKSFGDLRAVDAIDLTVPAGSFYGLVGPNGAGKTTTLSIIAGLLRADRGTITVNGVDASKKRGAAKNALGVLPDRLRTFDRLTGRQLLHYYGVLRGLPASVVESRTADLARAFDLVDALARPVSDYSAGMTKKVMLAGAMIHSPRLLVLDEPFEAVDPVSSATILDILGSYVRHGGTVILSSHGMELVERVCTRVAVIVSGQVLAEGTVDEVRGEATLEQRFLELAGGLGDVEGLEWLHTFSD